jgi:hypothetical protein
MSVTLATNATAIAISSGETHVSERLFEELAFCRSRLATVLELLGFGPSDPCKISDALFLADLLFLNQVRAAYHVMGRPVPEIASIERAKEAIGLLEGMPGKRALADCADRLHDANTALEDTSRQRAAIRASKLLLRVQRGLEAQARTKRLSEVFKGRNWRTWTRWTITLLVFIAAAWLGARLLSDMLTLEYFHTRTGHFFAITDALERYRAEHGAYPASANNGREWNGIGWKGDPQNWIPDLVPKYLPRIPSDPRNTTIPYAQYIYRSDGTNYKLIALSPEDCNAVITHRPKYSDPARNSGDQCSAYGVWSKDAAAW